MTQAAGLTPPLGLRSSAISTAAVPQSSPWLCEPPARPARCGSNNERSYTGRRSDMGGSRLVGLFESEAGQHAKDHRDIHIESNPH